MGWQDDAIAGAPAAPAPKAWETDTPVGPTPQQKAVTSANDNGEEAAKALQISKRTGIPAPTVQSDLPGYGEHDRRQSAIKAVQNPFIAKYVDNNPMAAKVSGDDYDKLDEVSQTLQALHPELMRSKTQAGMFAAIPEIAGMLGTGPGREKLYNALKELPGTLAKGILGFIETPGKVKSGEINLNTPEGLNEGIGFGIGVALGTRGVARPGAFGRPKGLEGVPGTPENNFLAGNETAIQRTQPVASFDDFMATIRGMKTRKEIDDFIASKQEGPAGAALQIEHAKAGSEALDKAMETAQTSKTRERSPELFAEAAEAHDPGNVHVDGAKLMELYQKEGKVPAPSDGLLGDVPGIAGKIAAAEATGGEVTIPVSQYIAYGKDAHEALRESVRLHDDGVTLEEAKEHEENIVTGYHGSQDIITDFDPSKTRLDRGVFFAEKPELASKFAQGLATDSDPLYIHGEDTPENIANFVRNFTGESEAQRIEKMIEEAEALPEKFENDEYSKQSNAINNELRKVSSLSDEFGGGAPNVTRANVHLGKSYEFDMEGKFDWNKERNAIRHAIDNNFDSVTFINTGEEGKFYTVFNKNQIKPFSTNPVEAAVEATTATEKKSLGLDTRVFMNMIFKDAKAIGITDTEFKAYSDKIARQEQMVLDNSVRMDKTEIARRLTPEWKRQETAVRDEIIGELKASGPFAAEKYLRENKIDLAHERAAEVAEGLAPLFGYENGQDLLRGLEGIETERAASGKGPQVQLRDAIKEETARRMEERHGVLAENIAKEARQMALSEHTFDVLADEVRILSKASRLAPPLSRSEMVDWAKQSFEGSNVVEAANWEKHRRAVERGGREAEKALLKGDFAEAFLAKQRQMLAAIVAKESLSFGKVVDSAERKIDRFSSEETIKGMDQAHLEQYRQVLASVGLPQRFAPLASTGTLRDFITESQGQLAVASWLMDGSQPKLQDMSVAEFRDFAKSLQSIEHVGRQATKMENLHGQADLQNVVFDAKKSMERFKFIDQPNHPSILQRAASVGRKVIGAHLLVERMFDYIDRFDPHGPLTEWIDRPLRDANTREIVLTEQVTKMLKDLRQHVDASINEKIENNLIPDAHDRSGFLSMTRQDLRVLMLNTGNWSNWKKLSEGFGVNEADLRRMVDTNATAKDVAWVNGIWKIFQHLKPFADEVQLKDTGVPVDHIPAVGWDVKAGTLDGGYYPLAYDRYNSDIQGHIARPLFDNGYFPATVPHGYTQARTEYKGAIDLTGAFLASKIQGMVHDISFRTAVRNADKLISNQEFRTALEQRWGKEAADLLPGWIRDIANSHNLDDNYARDFVRAASLVRQNVTSTLIGYNPGTFIKHGFTAAVMSADRVGLGALLSSTKEIGLSGAAKNLKELISKTDRVPDEQFMQAFRDLLDQGERGDNARQFVLDSSAVMRNRQRQYDESIRGAVDAINQIGPAKTFADFRQRQMQYARLAVAFSDQMSAMPTWLASYKKAYMGGEAHADAVFIADKDMSRAHGSNFVGDKPAVTRIGNSGPGELARWFTGLYNFWNHQFNNLMQLTWDMKAAIDGPGAQGSEPGANAWSISRRIAGIMAIIYIEEQATAAKDEDHRGLGARVAFATIRYLGGGIVGLRDITNGLAHGYEPSTGMIGTLYKAGTETAKDIGKATGAKAGLAKDWITHTATALGFATGIGGTQLGKTASFTKDLITGQERPRTFNDYRQGFRTGHSKARIHR